MKRLFCFLILFCICEVASAHFIKFTSRTTNTFLAKNEFDVYTPFFEAEDKMLYKIFYYPGKPLAMPEYPQFPASLYFQECNENQSSLHDWLDKIPNNKTLEHFVFFAPCKTFSEIKQDQINDFMIFWGEFSNLLGVDRLKNNLIASSKTIESAQLFVETLPEMYTSLTLLNSLPSLTHVNRYKGIRTRVYAARKSPKYTELKSAFEKFKSAGARAEWIEVDVSENELIKQTLATKKHWDWIKQISWEN